MAMLNGEGVGPNQHLWGPEGGWGKKSEVGAGRGGTRKWCGAGQS